jgi:hypothetical protein
MRTRKNRACYDRSKLRYPSDVTDEESSLVEPLILSGKPRSGKRTVILGATGGQTLDVRSRLCNATPASDHAVKALA